MSDTQHHFAGERTADGGEWRQLWGPHEPFRRYVTTAKILANGACERPDMDYPTDFGKFLQSAWCANGPWSETALKTRIMERFGTPDKRGAYSASEGEAALSRAIVFEGLWAGQGFPYVKVWPDMIGVLVKSPLSMQAAEVRGPFPIFEIIPHRDAHLSLVCDHGCEHEVFSLLFSGFQWKDRNVRIEVRAIIRTGDSRLDFLPTWINMDPEKPIESVFTSHPRGSDRIFRFVIGVCMVGTSDPTFIQHDLSDRQARRLHHADPKVREKTECEIDAQRRRFGFNMGKSINLPMHTEYHPHDPSEPTGRELSWGHLRRAHFGWRKRKEGKELVWRLRPIKMTRVRADLPLKPSRGYEIAAQESAK